MNEKMQAYSDDFDKLQKKIDQLLEGRDHADIVSTNPKNPGVHNMLRVFPISKDLSAISGPDTSVLDLVSRGALQFNMNWTDFFKFTKIMTLIHERKTPDLRVLDIGCRHGEIRALAYRNRVEIDYHGIDINLKILSKQCEWYTNKNSHFYVCNLNNGIPVEGYFDFIVLNDIIEHMNDKKGGIALMDRSLERIAVDGSFIITTPNSYEPGRLQYPNDHFYEFNLEELTFYLTSRGMEIVECYGTNILERHIKNIPEDKRHLLDEEGMLSTILGCRNAVMGLKLPEYARHVFIHAKKK